MIRTTIHAYSAGLPKALEKIVLEERAMEREGFTIVGFQAIETQRVLVVMYKAGRVSGNAASLVGD